MPDDERPDAVMRASAPRPAARPPLRLMRWRGVTPAAPPNPFREVERIAFSEVAQPDVYHTLLSMGWGWFFALLGAVYIGFNVVFALLFLLQPGSIVDAHPGSFGDAFFFSVQTMATVGYGDMRPASLYSNLLVVFEIMVGMAWLAVATGLIFARFSRPTARVLFSRIAVVTSYEGKPTLMFRAANTRRTQILEANVSVMLMRDEVTSDGHPMRRFYDLALSRAHTPMFILTWQVMHPIDAASPLYGETSQSLIDKNATIVVTVSGVEETFSQVVNGRWSYQADEIRWNERFVDILSWAPDGRRLINYHLFHDTIPTVDKT
jgi:inward rectifier potassium channel